MVHRFSLFFYFFLLTQSPPLAARPLNHDIPFWRPVEWRVVSGEVVPLGLCKLKMKNEKLKIKNGSGALRADFKRLRRLTHPGCFAATPLERGKHEVPFGLIVYAFGELAAVGSG